MYGFEPYEWENADERNESEFWQEYFSGESVRVSVSDFSDLDWELDLDRSLYISFIGVDSDGECSLTSDTLSLNDEWWMHGNIVHGATVGPYEDESGKHVCGLWLHTYPVERYIGAIIDLEFSDGEGNNVDFSITITGDSYYRYSEDYYSYTESYQYSYESDYSYTEELNSEKEEAEAIFEALPQVEWIIIDEANSTNTNLTFYVGQEFGLVFVTQMGQFDFNVTS